MASPETEKLRKEFWALMKEIEASRERDRELKRDVERALAKLRRLAAA